jgi:hypothetical protein
MAHADNVHALAELLFRVEHTDLGIVPPFERLPASRQEVFRRRALFLSNRGVVVANAVASDLHRALGLPDESADRLRERIEQVARGNDGGSGV